MAFRFNEFGPLVDRDPKKAAEKLSERIADNGNNLSVTAKKLDVDYRTLMRWLGKLLAAGYDVRASALELQVDRAAVARARGEEPPSLPARVGRPFRPRAGRLAAG